MTATIDLCPGTGREVRGNWGAFAPCPVCGKRVRIRKSGDIGTHKKAAADA